MAKFYLARHAEAPAQWFVDADPALSALGKQQAETAARAFVSRAPLPILSSPMKRARETAAASNGSLPRRL